MRCIRSYLSGHLSPHATKSRLFFSSLQGGDHGTCEFSKGARDTQSPLGFWWYLRLAAVGLIGAGGFTFALYRILLFGP